MRRHRPHALRLLAFLLLGLAPGAPAAPAVPRDSHGLPQWEVRVYRDFPVRVDLPSPEALASLLQAVPIADFDREQVRPGPGGRVTLETRVTDAEARALESAGVSFERLPDVEQEVRRAMEAEWARQAAEGDGLRGELRGVYHTHAQIGTIFQQAETSYPALARRLNIGSSVQGRELWTLEISDDVGVDEAEPEVRLAGAIHGNEPVGLEMLLYLVDHLLANYGTDPVVTDLVENTDLFITPCLNPDGLTAGIRRNAHNVDLNRNYPVPDGSIGDDGTWTREPETVAVIDFGAAHHFVVSENGHTGALVVNYPWDYTYTLAPDDAAIILLSLEYSTYNLPMYNGAWLHGITNGAQWYVVKGSLQDWSYADTGCIDVTIEMSNTYAPPPGQLDVLWNDNRESFLHYVRAARYGVHGLVTDSVTGAPLAATVSIVGNTKPVTTDPDRGDYYKLLPTGTYTVVVSADGHATKTVPGVSTVWGTPAVLDVPLDPIGTGVDALAASAASLVSSPNPFIAGTTLRFTLARAERVRLSIFDAGGRRVASLLDGERPAGTCTVDWDGRTGAGAAAANGVYFARLERDGRIQVTKLTLVR
jgi:hypothetical protein